MTSVLLNSACYFWNLTIDAGIVKRFPHSFCIPCLLLQKNETVLQNIKKVPCTSRLFWNSVGRSGVPGITIIKTTP
jgi:hypothetical protein